jgi:DeoR/GlpR family transcriptional regulator of sugar metabolism
MELSSMPGVTLIVIGGIILPDFFAVVGPLSELSLSELYVDKAFMSVAGVSVEHGLTGPNQLEALAYRAMMQRAGRTVVLADHSKLGRVALYRIAPLAAAYVVITDDDADAQALQSMKAAGIEVLAA